MEVWIWLEAKVRWVRGTRMGHMYTTLRNTIYLANTPHPTIGVKIGNAWSTGVSHVYWPWSSPLVISAMSFQGASRSASLSWKSLNHFRLTVRHLRIFWDAQDHDANLHASSFLQSGGWTIKISQDCCFPSFKEQHLTYKPSVWKAQVCKNPIPKYCTHNLALMRLMLRR